MVTPTDRGWRFIEWFLIVGILFFVVMLFFKAPL
jgi:hypothetical protein